MPSLRIMRFAIPSLILVACLRSHPAPTSPGPMPPASGAPMSIAANAGKGQYQFPPAATQAQRAGALQAELSIVTHKIRQCWNIAAPKGPTRSVVSIRVDQVDPDGTVPPGGASIASDGGDPTSALAALRAVTNPLCQPWPTPQGGWPNSFVLVFANTPS